MGQGQSRADVSSPQKAFSSSGSPSSKEVSENDQPIYPDPSGHEYDEIDKLQAELPSIIDEESRQQVDDYIQACDGGKGPMVACFATGEYISMFERKVSGKLREESIQITIFSTLTRVSYNSTKRHLIYLKMFVSDLSKTNPRTEKKWMAQKLMPQDVSTWLRYS